MYSKPSKFRSRYLLPMEMALAVVVFVLGIGGAFGHGRLSALLAARQDTLEWALVLGGAGAVWLAVAVAEWFLGLSWEIEKIRIAVRLRMICSGAACVGWLLCGYVLADGGRGGQYLVFIMLTPPMFALCVWSWYVNYRTDCLLDPNLDTTKLEKRLEERLSRF